MSSEKSGLSSLKCRRMLLTINFIIFSFIVMMPHYVCGQNLTKAEVQKILEKEFRNCTTGYTSMINFRDGDENGPNSAKIAYQILVDNELINRYPLKRSSRSLQYETTEKAKPFFTLNVDQRVYANGVEKLVINGNFICGEIQEINKILVDRENGIAEVEVAIVYVPVEPFYSLVCTKNEYCMARNSKAIGKKEIKTIRFKKFHKGWRVMK